MVISVAQADALFDQSDQSDYEDLVDVIDQGIRANYQPQIGYVTISLPKMPNGRVECRIRDAYEAGGWKQVTFKATSKECVLSKHAPSYSQFDR